MGSFAQSVPNSNRRSSWIWELIRDELVLYPGRTALVGRMVLSATLSMLIVMTFRIPFGAYCAIYSLTISHESLQITAKTAVTRTVSFALGTIYVLIGATVFVDDPMLRLLWVCGTMFMTFYGVSAMSTFASAVNIGYLIAMTTPLWDKHISGELRVEGTLWAAFALTIGSTIAVLVELLFDAIRPGNDLLRSIAERLASVESVLDCYGTGVPVDQRTAKTVTRLAMLGTSRLRHTLRNSNFPREYREQMGAVVALAGRQVDIAASLLQLGIQARGADRERLCNLATSISTIRTELLDGRSPTEIHLNDWHESSGVPLLHELEKTVRLIPEVFSGAAPMSELGLSASVVKQSSTFFVPDAFSNLDHLKFGLKGGLAASLCYMTYNSIAWPGISTAVTTVVLTALSTVGFSRQKQVLRFSGAVVGGLIFGIGAQILILPYLDSIVGFTVLFVAVSTVGAWFATSSPRLAYFGIQIIVAFYLINLQEFKEQISLGVARDRVVGILLGLFIMWVVFDKLWPTLAAVEVKRAFISNLRALADFVRQPVAGERKVAIERGYSLRETIHSNFDKVKSLADGLLFEFGPSRQQDLALRGQIRRWQPQLRMLFLTRITLFKYRLQLPGFELPSGVLASQVEFDGRLAATLDLIANRLENTTPPEHHDLIGAFERLQSTARAYCMEGSSQSTTIELETLLSLSRTAENLVASLANEI
jgi:multidrug resistance protein MdtO